MHQASFARRVPLADRNRRTALGAGDLFPIRHQPGRQQPGSFEPLQRHGGPQRDGSIDMDRDRNLSRLIVS